MHIQRKGSKDKQLSEAQERRNKRIAEPRARVEHVFAGLAQLGGKVLRSIGLVRATLHLNWKAAVYNLQRLSYLKEAGIGRFDARGAPEPQKMTSASRRTAVKLARLGAETPLTPKLFQHALSNRRLFEVPCRSSA